MISLKATTTSTRLVFLHIPKTGGNTLHKVIEKQYKSKALLKIRGRQYLEEIEKFKRLTNERRAEIQALTGHMYFGLHEYLSGPVRYITFLREPVDRAISLYYHILRNPKNRLHQSVVSQKMTLADFARSNTITEADNDQVRYLAGVGRSLPFGQCTPALLEQAKQNLLKHFAVIGLTERFDESLLLIAQHFGWKIFAYQSHNVGGNRPKIDGIPPEARADIEEQNRFDSELYQWARVNFEKIIAQQGPGFQRRLQRLRARNQLLFRLTSIFKRQPLR